MSWMLTAGARKIAPGEILPQDIAIEDIAAHLAKICRFTGATRCMYSVAEHSVMVSDLLAERFPEDLELQLCGLLHDGPEYLLNDLATPVKDIVGGFYRPLERSVWWAIAERFQLPMRLPIAVQIADLQALATEKRDLMPEHPEPWSVLEDIHPHPQMRCGDPERTWREAERLFLDTFHRIQGERATQAARACI